MLKGLLITVLGILIFIFGSSEQVRLIHGAGMVVSVIGMFIVLLKLFKKLNQLEFGNDQILTTNSFRREIKNEDCRGNPSNRRTD